MNSDDSQKPGLSQIKFNTPGPEDSRSRFGNVWVIVFDASKLSVREFRRNVWGFSVDGIKLWEIHPTPYTWVPNPHTWASLEEQNGKVEIEHSGDDRNYFLLNVETGAVTNPDGSNLPHQPDREPNDGPQTMTYLGPNPRRVPQPGPLARLIYWLKFKCGKSHKRPPCGPEFRRKPKAK